MPRSDNCNNCGANTGGEAYYGLCPGCFFAHVHERANVLRADPNADYSRHPNRFTCRQCLKVFPSNFFYVTSGMMIQCAFCMESTLCQWYGFRIEGTTNGTNRTNGTNGHAST